MISQALRTLLLSDPRLTGILGQRVIIDRYPQPNETPCVVMWVEGEIALDAIDGPLGMDQPKMRVRCYAKTRTGATALRLEVRRILGGFYGVVDGVFIKGIAQVEPRGERYDYDRERRGTDENRFYSEQDFRVTYDYERVQP
jgi:hypothetical protein